MGLPSYLNRNRFGIFYFHVVFPQAFCDTLNRNETRRSLRRHDFKITMKMSLEFQQISSQLF